MIDVARKIVTPGERTAARETIRRRLENRPDIICAYLHGSFLTEERYRDIDVAVWIEPLPPSPGAVTRYTLDLSTELSLALGQPVDVQVLNRAPLTFRHHALKGQPLVVRDWDWLDELRARTWDDYADFLPFARRGGRSPDDYADCIAILGELGAIDEHLKARLVRMARLRNLLVHLYARVDDTEVYRIIREELGLRALGAGLARGRRPCRRPSLGRCGLTSARLLTRWQPVRRPRVPCPPFEVREDIHSVRRDRVWPVWHGP